MTFDYNSFAILYSQTQDSFHIHTIREMIDDNIDIFEGNLNESYMVLEITRNREDADVILAHFKDIKQNHLNNSRDKNKSIGLKHILASK